MNDLTPDKLVRWCRELVPGYDAWDTAGPGHVFDVEAAIRTCLFFHECLTFSNAEWLGRPFVLQPWQAAVVGSLFGWKRADGTRRYRRCLLFTARKSGKTELAAGIANVLLFIDGEPAPEMVSAAASAEQATRVFNAAKLMVEHEPELSRRSTVFKRAIENVENGGSYRVINAAAGTKHGANLHAALIDELHAIPDPELVDVLETSMGSRRQPLVLYTTTAGDNPESIAGETYDFACKVRDGLIDDPEFLPVVYEAPADADPGDRTAWKLAQPNLGTTVPVEVYEKEYAEALQVPRKMHRFRQLRMNQWVEAASAWIALEDWRACAGNVDPPAGAACYLGLDLSSTQDTTAIVAVFPDGGRFLVKPIVFLPGDNAAGRIRRQKRDKAPYLSWAEQGQLILTDGNAIDYDAVFAAIMELAERYDVREIQADPFNATDILQRLEREGLTVTTVRQGWSLAEATKETERLILAGGLIHPNHPVLNWQLSNAVVHSDRHENIWLDKAKSTRRIDAAVAMVMAINAARFGAGAAAPQAYSGDSPELLLLG